MGFYRFSEEEVQEIKQRLDDLTIELRKKQERVYPHLFSFVITPAASGKGVLKNAKRSGDKIHERMVESSKQAKDQHENEMIEYKAQLSKRKKDDPIPEKPKEPVFKLLFIPADCSQAMMMQILQDKIGRAHV